MSRNFQYLKNTYHSILNELESSSDEEYYSESNSSYISMLSVDCSVSVKRIIKVLQANGNKNSVWNSHIIQNALDKMPITACHYVHRIPTYLASVFIIQMFCEVYINYHIDPLRYRFFLYKMKNHIKLNALKITPKMWKVSNFPKQEYINCILDNNIPDDIIQTYEHHTTIKEINNQKFQVFLNCSKNRNSHIFAFFHNKIYDSNMLKIISSYL